VVQMAWISMREGRRMKWNRQSRRVEI
jgi:hypothetical protein